MTKAAHLSGGARHEGSVLKCSGVFKILSRARWRVRVLQGHFPATHSLTALSVVQVRSGLLVLNWRAAAMSIPQIQTISPSLSFERQSIGGMQPQYLSSPGLKSCTHDLDTASWNRGSTFESDPPCSWWLANSSHGPDRDDRRGSALHALQLEMKGNSESTEAPFTIR
jgi:hypothetical protein